ncbi:MAG: hypothetical protein U0W24_24500 [Bacteroidales bacterium]
MERGEILEIVKKSVQEVVDDESIDIKEQTVLLGNEAVVDSMGLVNLIVDIESALSDKGLSVTLTSEKAMSLRNSPFRNIESLTNYILELIG